MNLRTARKRAGLTQTALAKRTGLQRPHIAAYESGGKRMSENVSDVLAEELDVDSLELIIGNRKKSLDKALDEEDFAEVLRIASQIVTLAEKHGGANEDEVEKFASGVLKTVSKARPDLVPADAAAGSSRKSRARDDEDEDDSMMGRDAFGRRMDRDNGDSDSSETPEDDDDTDEDGLYQRDFTGRRMRRVRKDA